MGHAPVLVVDDDPAVCELVRAVLEDAGFDVYAAANGREALDVLQTRSPLPGLILLDLAMPVMTGEEMLRALRAVHALATIPVAVVTGSDAAKPPDATSLLRKPIDVDALLRVVRQNC
ncbi:MAG TPA: response regulator [Minicystis sp.]|nr:response regulator [Minicystis sp.]